MSWIDELIGDLNKIPKEVETKILVSQIKDEIFEELHDIIKRKTGGIR